VQPRPKLDPLACQDFTVIADQIGRGLRARRRASLSLAAAGLLLLAGCVTPTASSSSPDSPEVGATSGRPAATLLAGLPVKGRAAMTAYSREMFGRPWADTNANGCDTRDDVLTRDLAHRRYERGTSSCVVAAGDLRDPYTGHTIHFRRGYGSLVDIDHVVALGNAWATGAFRWDASKRLQFANDPANLLAVDASANRQKGDGDAATWLPRNKAFRCEYVARQISTKATYGLWVTPPERDAMTRVLGRCPGEQLPARGPTPAQARPGARLPFASCAAARAAGAAPVHRGEPGYSSRLDRDGDGTGCE
jgi:hypothetical protein